MFVCVHKLHKLQARLTLCKKIKQPKRIFAGPSHRGGFSHTYARRHAAVGQLVDDLEELVADHLHAHLALDDARQQLRLPLLLGFPPVLRWRLVPPWSAPWSAPSPPPVLS